MLLFLGAADLHLVTNRSHAVCADRLILPSSDRLFQGSNQAGSPISLAPLTVLIPLRSESLRCVSHASGDSRACPRSVSSERLIKTLCFDMDCMLSSEVLLVRCKDENKKTVGIYFSFICKQSTGCRY